MTPQESRLEPARGAAAKNQTNSGTCGYISQHRTGRPGGSPSGPRNPMHCAGPFPPFTFPGKDHVPITTRMTRFHAEKPRNGADGRAGTPPQ